VSSGQQRAILKRQNNEFFQDEDQVLNNKFSNSTTGRPRVAFDPSKDLEVRRQVPRDQFERVLADPKLLRGKFGTSEVLKSFL
jgi:hypothetical protein